MDGGLTVDFFFLLEGFHFCPDVPNRTEVSSGQNLSRWLYVATLRIKASLSWIGAVWAATGRKNKRC